MDLDGHILDAATLDDPACVQSLKARLGDASALELLSCSVAQGAGTDFVRKLARVLGVPVHASSRAVGPAHLGGTYFLDFGYCPQTDRLLPGYEAAPVPGLTMLLAQPTRYVSVTFSHGYLGTQANQQQPQDIYVFGSTFNNSDGAIQSVTFRQDDSDLDGKFGGVGLQGNDLDGELVITFAGANGMNGATQAVFPGYLNFRELENDGVHVLGFLLYAAPTTDQVTISEDQVKGTLNGSQDGWFDYISGPLKSFNTTALSDYNTNIAQLPYDHLAVGNLSDKDVYPGYQFTTTNWSSTSSFPNSAGGTDTYRILSGPGKDVATNIGLIAETRVGNFNDAFNLPIHNQDRSNDTNAANSGLLDVLNDYLAASTPVSISSPSVVESNATAENLCELEYRVVLADVSTEDAAISYDYSMVAGAGVDGSDWSGTLSVGEVVTSSGDTYTASSAEWADYGVVLGLDGRLTVPQSVVEFTICVDVSDDTQIEDTETLTLTIAETVGVGTILDNEGAFVNVNDVTVNEASVAGALFTVNASPGDVLALSLSDGDGTAGSAEAPGVAAETTDDGSQDYLTGFEYYDVDVADWLPYSAPVTVNSSGTLYVRVALIDDTANEGAHYFQLTAVNQTAGNITDTGLGTILDNGEGSLFDDVPPPPVDDPLTIEDDDRPLTVSSIEVNEASPYAVFLVSGAAGQLASLALPGTGTATPAAGTNPDYGAGLEYWDATANDWLPYTSGTVELDANGDLLVRTTLVNDDIADDGETFELQATNTGGVSATGTATIRDNGTGTIYPDLPPSNGSTPTEDSDATPDDDGTLSVNSITVNEASNYALFTLTANEGLVIDELVLSDNETAGVDEGTIEVWSPTNNAWEPFTEGATATVDSTGTLFVRVSIIVEQEENPDNGETFNLLAGSTRQDAGQGPTGIATIVDDGTGVIFPGDLDTETGLPLQSTEGLDDDQLSPEEALVQRYESCGWMTEYVAGENGASLLFTSTSRPVEIVMTLSDLQPADLDLF